MPLSSPLHRGTLEVLVVWLQELWATYLGCPLGGASARSAWGVLAGVFDAVFQNLVGQLSMRADSTPDEKIRKRVGWLNKNQVLPCPTPSRKSMQYRHD